MTVRITQTKGKDVDAKLLGASRGMAQAITTSLRQSVAMSVKLENIAIAQMAGGDRMLRNQRRKMSAKGGLRNQRYAAGEAAVGPRGPVALINNGATPHLIGVGKASKAVRQRNKVKIAGIHNQYSKYNVEKHSGRKKLYLSDRDVWTTAPVLHPGMKGKGQWSAVRDNVIAPEASRMMRFAITRGTMGGYSMGR